MVSLQSHLLSKLGLILILLSNFSSPSNGIGTSTENEEEYLTQRGSFRIFIVCFVILYKNLNLFLIIIIHYILLSNSTSIYVL